jgi:hypothetical protein
MGGESIRPISLEIESPPPIKIKDMPRIAGIGGRPRVVRRNRGRADRRKGASSGVGRRAGRRVFIGGINSSRIAVGRGVGIIDRRVRIGDRTSPRG